MKREAELLEDRAYDYVCNAGTRDAVGLKKKKKTHLPMEWYIT